MNLKSIILCNWCKKNQHLFILIQKELKKVPHDVILEAIKQEFDLTPAGIIHTLNLRTPIYKKDSFLWTLW